MLGSRGGDGAQTDGTPRYAAGPAEGEEAILRATGVHLARS